MSLSYIFRPLQWTGESTPAAARRSRYTFKAPWSDTLRKLETELDHLAAKNIVIQADFTEYDLRQDGMPRANARQPVFPGVRLAFDSKHGPLAYATDTHEFWQHNVRAIALSLEALRAVDRYGVTKKAEQYKGWRELPSGATPMPSTQVMTFEEAGRFIAEQSNPDEWQAANETMRGHLAHFAMNLTQYQRQMYRAAAGRLHPDRGGNRELWNKLQAAREVLDANQAAVR